MAWSTENLLRAISAVCQLYYASYSATSLYLGLNVTLPEYCAEDKGLLQIMTFLLVYVFLNMMGNFFCIIYKSRLSIVPPPPNAEREVAQLREHFQSSSPSSSSSSVSSLAESSSFNGEKHNLYSKKFDDPFHQNHAMLNNNGTEPQHYAASNNELGNGELDKLHSLEAKYDCKISGLGNTGSEILGGWRRCKDCLALTPPRGKHCPLCKHCVLKRDHHCYFVGRCIGFHNQRFFVCFCLYGGLGGLFSLWLTSQYLRAHYEALQTWGRFAYLGPFALVHWGLGYTSGSSLGMVMFWWWSLLTSLMGCCYCFGQVILVVRGQTKWEFFQDIWTYRGTVMGNIHSVFGRFWPVGFFIPAPFLGYVGDGANWDSLMGEWKSL